ncbi:max-like protein X isoform X3 [Erpetoichthys calabaricus]|uniref:max-like protein X isoform X3 n=1 Tax=Erpetoichthys calabaricus TaxID=27687 RepID=UPI002233FC8A|nr:max-like protein X isoform X3 [Erpetoichthys calabaricus]
MTPGINPTLPTVTMDSTPHSFQKGPEREASFLEQIALDPQVPLLYQTQKGYSDLQSIVPTCLQQDPLGSQKMSKATILQKTIDYIQFLHKEKKKQEEELSTLRKEVLGLKIMKANYEQIVKAHQNNPHQGRDQVSDQMKFNVFQGIMDSLFESFNASISVTNFQELSACIFSWIEEHCKPQTLRDIVLGVLSHLNGQLY